MSPGTAPIYAHNLWRSQVGPGYFEAFERPILAGRELHAGDVGAATVIVNEAFARRFTSGASPVGLRVEAIAAELDPGIRLYEVLPLDELAWRQDADNLVVAASLAGIVGLVLFLSGAGIFSLMSVNVARRTSEIGLRSALGAGPARLFASVFSRALVLIGSGIVAGNLVLFGLVIFL